MKMHEKDISNEELAIIITKGFDNVQGQFEEVNEKLVEVNERLDNIDLKMDNFAYALDVKNLKKRMSVVERKIGIK